MMKAKILIPFLILSSCMTQPDQSAEVETKNRFADPAIRQVADWQDRRYTDSLFVAMDDSILLNQALMALASVQDSTGNPILYDMIQEGSPETKKLAALALGQSFEESAFAHLIEAYKKTEDEVAIIYILEAAGKTATRETIDELARLKISGSAAATGLSFALYRAATRGINSKNATYSALNILDTASSKDAQLMSAHYLQRGADLKIPDWGYVVLKNKISVEDPEVRMAVAGAFKHVPTQVSGSVLIDFLEDEDYRVVINALRSLSPAAFANLDSDIISNLLNHENPNVAVTMGQELLAHSDDFDQDFLRGELSNLKDYRVKGLLYQAMLRKEPHNNALIKEIKQEFTKTESPYAKAFLLIALGESIIAHEFIVTETFKANHPAISTSGITALTSLRRTDSFPEELERPFAEIMKNAIESGDVAMIDISSALLRDTAYNFREHYDTIQFLYDAKEKLSLPKEIETLQSIEKTIAIFEGRQVEPIENEFNNPIDWSILENIKSVQPATIITNKGNIELNLYTDDAPGSVANFISLVKSGYYNNRSFHRVVPNFVVQGGGNRGDGWGGEDYSIRSEFTDRRYTTGSVGMASAGKDTEGTQWFITHSPTPHLDGRYTIFAEVVDGMDVVHHIEVGDTIRSVTIK